MTKPADILIATPKGGWPKGQLVVFVVKGRRAGEGSQQFHYDLSRRFIEPKEDEK